MPEDRNTAKLKEQIRNQVIAELFGTGGVTYDTAAKEVLYYLPGDFVRLYTQLFHEAYRDTDGGTNGRGVSSAEKGAIGRVSNPTDLAKGHGNTGAGGKGSGRGVGLEHEPRDKSGAIIGRGHIRNTQKSMRGAKQASAKNTFGYNGRAGEEIAALKTRIDKRLRAIARSAAEELRDIREGNLQLEREAIEHDVESGTLGKGEGSRRIARLIAEQKELDEQFGLGSGGRPATGRKGTPTSNGNQNDKQGPNV